MAVTNTPPSEKMVKMKKEIKELQEMAEADCTFDKEERAMLETQFDNTKAMVKWIKIKQQWSDLFRQLELKRKKIYVSLHTTYKTESSLKINTKGEMEIFIDVDSQYIEANALCIMCKDCLTMIGEIIEAIKAKNYEIQRYIKYLEFINGK